MGRLQGAERQGLRQVESRPGGVGDRFAAGRIETLAELVNALRPKGVRNEWHWGCWRKDLRQRCGIHCVRSVGTFRSRVVTKEQRAWRRAGSDSVRNGSGCDSGSQRAAKSRRSLVEVADYFLRL